MTDILKQTQERRERDAQRWREHDQNLCMLCHSYGADKRSLFIECFYDISEVLPEAIDLFLCGDHLKDKGYYLRICKTCRGALLVLLAQWRKARMALRGVPKDHDGYELDFPEDANIPVRICGATVMMTKKQYQAYKEKDR